METVSREIIQEFIGWTAFGFSLIFLFMPTIPFYKLIKGKLELEETPIALITITYISCFCWYIYSNMLYSSQIKCINLIGMVTNGLMIIIYLLHEVKEYLKDTILNALIISFGSYLIYLIFDNIIENDKTIGKICIGVVCVLSIFQIKDIFKALVEKEISYINIVQSWFILTTVTLWGFYGYMINELYFVFPQVIFGILAIFEICIYAQYKNNKFKMIHKKKDIPKHNPE